MPSATKFCLGLAAAAASATLMPPTMPDDYYVRLTWSENVANNTYQFAHLRWYDLTNQQYRDDTVNPADYSAVYDTTLEKPASNQQLWDMDYQRGTCTTRKFVAHIDGYVQTWNNMTCALTTLQHGGAAVKSIKCTKTFVGPYDISVWWGQGDKNVADGTPLQQYNSNDEKNGFSVVTLSDYNTSIAGAFTVPPKCAGLVPPAPTPPAPTPDAPHWMRDWSKTACSCIHVAYVAGYMTEGDCLAKECA
jgi:hypothetical protein